MASLLDSCHCPVDSHCAWFYAGSLQYCPVIFSEFRLSIRVGCIGQLVKLLVRSHDIILRGLEQTVSVEWVAQSRLRWSFLCYGSCATELFHLAASMLHGEAGESRTSLEWSQDVAWEGKFPQMLSHTKYVGQIRYIATLSVSDTHWYARGFVKVKYFSVEV